MFREHNTRPTTLGETKCKGCTGLSAGLPDIPMMGPAAVVQTAFGKGTNEEKAKMATELLITGGIPLTMIPVIGPMLSKVLSPITGFIGGMFKKATHMGDCMKWFSNSNNIRGMIGGRWVEPIGIDITAYYPGMDKPLRQRYDELMAQGDRLGINTLLDTQRRRNKIISNFIAAFNANPDVQPLICMSNPKVQAEQGNYSVTPAYVESILDMFRDQSQQAEYVETIQELENKLNPLNILGINATQWTNVQKARGQSSAIPIVIASSPGGTVMPTYKNGAMQIIPGTAQPNYVTTIQVGPSTVRRK